MHTGNTVLKIILISIVAVYPCAYREHQYYIHLLDGSGGLSLCIQGTRPCLRPCCWRRRFIPVHTGNTLIMGNLVDTKSVYPCAYREHDVVNAVDDIKRGLSLCIQGTRNSLIDETPPKRFIPVHTGNTSPTGISFNPSGGLSLCIQGTHQL